jgi:hypothetical protein
MALQSLIVALLVLGCSGYAAWALMPAAARRALAAAVLKLHPPRWLAARLRQAAAPASSCGCSGCDRAPPAARDAAQPLRFHPRKH